MQNELVTQGLNLLVLGMGVVFVFLALLVAATSVMSKTIQRYLPEPVPVAAVAEDRSTLHRRAPPNDKILAVIKAALEQHRDR